MAINTKLELRQTHSLVMTPQLQQAIKLLQLSNMELASFVDGELERNPLLERDDADEPNGADESRTSALNGEADDASSSASGGGADGSGDSDDWVDFDSGSGASQTADLDADPQDMFPDSETFTPGALKDSGWSGLTQGPRMDVDEGTNLEAYVAEEKTLRDHLTDQLCLAFTDPAQRLIGQHLIDMTRRTRRAGRTARRALGTRRGDAARDAELRALWRVCARPA
jgi:RNA polymerase sigma-54 factor